MKLPPFAKSINLPNLANVSRFRFGTKFGLKAEADFLNKLGLYLSAHITLTEALTMLQEQTTARRKKETFAGWKALVENGKSLAQAFDEFDGLRVSEITKHAAELGEKSASLGISLKEAGNQIKRSLTLKKKVMGAVAYPAVIVIATLGLVLGLMLFVFPKIIPLFKTLKVTLPLSTRILIWVSTFLSGHWRFILLLLFCAVFGFLTLQRFSERGRAWTQYVLLRLPCVGRVIQMKILCSTFDSLHLLLRGGEQLSESLLNVTEIVSFYEYKKLFKEAAFEVTEGRSPAEFFKQKKKYVPPYVFGILAVGERTGNIESALKDVAEITREDLDDMLRVLMAALEPALMISMSAVIGFIAISIILPIYGITSHFQNV